ncbi:MAG: cysteine desulfurase-like protein [Proteobacteria bacterium]|nr:cysteine desulfurase-like protein [Pseudomonadota bacterium]
MSSSWSIDAVRAAFPALALQDDGVARAYLDAPAGTQMAGRSIDRMVRLMTTACANDGGVFRTSVEGEATMFEAHRACAALLNAASFEEIVFGLNTTSLLFHVSRILARDWRAGDEIVLSRMDHDANVAPWLAVAEERGVAVRWLDFDTETFRYDYDSLDALIGPRTRLVACNHASNLLGTINDVKRIAEAARAVGAVSVVDGVQSAPHMLTDVQALGCDLFVFSPYKVFGPHAGVLWMRGELMDRLTPLKVRPSPQQAPWMWAPGTPSFEAQAGVLGAIEHIAWLGGLGSEATLREQLAAGWRASQAWEGTLMRRFLAGLKAIPGMRLYGLGGDNELADRVPTFSFTLPGRQASEVVSDLASHNVFAWAGSFYAHEIAQRLGVAENGVVRVGLAHYTSKAEVDRALALLSA